jgi:DNA primase large subunit
MRKDINLQNNNLQNGYIYKELIQRIDKLENTITGIMKDIETAKNNMTISVKDYLVIIKLIEKNITREEFERHVDNKEIHLHESKTLTD